MENIQNDSAAVKSQSRITWGSTLATGFDRLKIGFYVKWESEIFLTKLDTAKIEAREADDLQPISFSENGDLVFNCHPTGRKGGYGYHLSRCDVNLFFSKRKDFDTPNVWIDIGSESCWSPGYKLIVNEIKKLIHDQGGFIVKDTISEVHLCADFIGLDIEEIPIDDYSLWITRANRFSCFQDRRRFSGIEISQEEGELPPTGFMSQTGIIFGRGDIMLRIYDKTMELERSISKQSLFASVWNKAEFNDEPVTRVEFQLRRLVLKQMKVNSYQELEEKKNAIWKYCTQEWTRLSMFSVDRKNRHQDRAETHPWWAEVQEIEITGTGEEIKREYARSSKDMEPLKNMIAGCALTIGTILNRKANDLEGVIAYGQGMMENALRALHNQIDDNGKSEFEKRMEKRWSEVWPFGYELNLGMNI